MLTLDRTIFHEALDGLLDRKAENCAAGDCGAVVYVMLDGLQLLPAGAFLMACEIEDLPGDLGVNDAARIDFFTRRVAVPHCRSVAAITFGIYAGHG